ncbi:MAG: hydrogenase maturation nickel metallochaperone HypA [Vicinamibacterales bacterium]
MHELGIATSILDIVQQYVPAERAGLVRLVHVRVGEMAGVVPETLAFCFSVATEGTPYRSAVLAIEQVPMMGRCKDCGATLTMSTPTFWCPECNSPRVQLTSGRELDVLDVELDDAAP